jgi:hypothetical protein
VSFLQALINKVSGDCAERPLRNQVSRGRHAVRLGALPARYKASSAKIPPPSIIIIPGIWLPAFSMAGVHGRLNVH